MPSSVAPLWLTTVVHCFKNWNRSSKVMNLGEGLSGKSLVSRMSEVKTDRSNRVTAKDPLILPNPSRGS